MMNVSVRCILGLGPLPNHRASAVDWLKRNGVTIYEAEGPGGRRFEVRLTDLPEDVRLAWWQRELDGLHLEPGTFDAAAHEAFQEASADKRQRAERKAHIVSMLVALERQGVKRKEQFALIQEKFGSEGTSKKTLTDALKKVRGVDPINYAPALLDNYRTTAQRAEMSEDAWRFFLSMIRDAGPDWCLKEAYRRVRDVGNVEGWAVPSSSTFYRRWHELTPTQQSVARHGRAATVKRMAQPIIRDKTTLMALEQVSLDGRTQDFWVDWGDGRAVRPTMLVLVDVASNSILDWELAPSENAVATVRLVKRVCQTYGIFDTLYTDNGSAFSGHLVAGGNPHRFRNGTPKGVQPMGICRIMGIKLTHSLPSSDQHNGAKAKIAERVFATLSRSVDDGPEFKGAHAGHAPGASPSPKVKPIPVERAKAILAREIARYNREPGRTGQGARGRSCEAILREGLSHRVTIGRPIRKPTEEQLYLAGLTWKPASVDRYGRVTANGWQYGGPETQDILLRYHQAGRKILLGRDPDNLAAPAIAYDDKGRLICRNIEPVKAGAYTSTDGIREAARNRKAARDAAKAAETANNYLEDKDYDRLMSVLDATVETEKAPPSKPAKVVGARFGAPLSVRQEEAEGDETSAIIEQFDRVNGFDPKRVLGGQ